MPWTLAALPIAVIAQTAPTIARFLREMSSPRTPDRAVVVEDVQRVQIPRLARRLRVLVERLASLLPLPIGQNRSQDGQRQVRL